MMENNKYYTPDITEFCIGFECEYYNKHSKNWVPMVVEESNYYVDDIGGPEEDYIFKGNYVGHDKTFRVKFLDQTDIEELGYQHVGGKLDGRTRQLFSKKVDKGYYTHLECTWFSFGCVIKIETSVDEYSERTQVVHSITIKNKHELKKLMQQLNII